jgi:uncharacterized protein (DUF952 family)
MLIYKICDATLWEAAVEAGEFKGAEIDLTDGYISSGVRVLLSSPLKRMRWAMR